MDTQGPAYEQMMLPPPWRVHVGGGYINDITQEIIDTHPLKRAAEIQQRTSRKLEDAVVVAEPEDPELRSRHEEFTEYKCTWEERSLFGNPRVFGMTIRFFDSDHSSIIKFEEVDGEWRYSLLESPYGPVDRYDLFLGSQIKVFGRHMSISSTSGSTCEWIEKEGARLRKRISDLQQRLESLGAVPCVMRAPPEVIRNMSRRATKPGSVNLRRLKIEMLKLQEQLVDLGVAHMIS